MTFLQALLLGVVQGLSEFLPVSSSGHLALFQYFMDLNEVPIVFDVIVHMGTLMAVVIFFYKQILAIRWQEIKLLAIGTIPAVIVGLMLKDVIDSLFASMLVVSLGFFVSGGLLVSTRKIAINSLKGDVKLKDAIYIGIAQAMAIIPGISRSGSTVSTSLWRGIEKKQAFSFSFLLSIPAIIGALLLQLYELGNTKLLVNTVNMVGFFSALVVGLFALQLLRLIIDKAKLYLFGYYCLGMGGLALVLYLVS